MENTGEMALGSIFYLTEKDLLVRITKMSYQKDLRIGRRPMKFYKITNLHEKHYGMQYTTGLNVDIREFNPRGSCNAGGLHYAREDILYFLNYGVWLREVTIPEDAKEYKDPQEFPSKWKADKIILGERREITEEVLLELVEEGATLCAGSSEYLHGFFGFLVTKHYDKLIQKLINAVPENTEFCLPILEWAARNNDVDLIKKFKLTSYSENYRYLRQLAIFHGRREAYKLLSDLYDESYGKYISWRYVGHITSIAANSSRNYIGNPNAYYDCNLSLQQLSCV